MSKPNGYCVYHTGSYGSHSVVDGSDRSHHYSGAEHYEHDLHVGHCSRQRDSEECECMRTIGCA